MKQSIVMVSRDVSLTDAIRQMVNDSYLTYAFASMQNALEYIYQSIPGLLIYDFRKDDRESLTILSDLKEDPIFKQLPVLAVLPDNVCISDWHALLVEDYVRESLLGKDIVDRINLSMVRSERIVEMNPLTRLPGNISINRQIQERLEKGDMFALAYTDLDYFKPFNDKYGFGRGDEVIKITGRIITNAVKNIQPRGSFVGHIGGDDFVFTMLPSLVEKAAQDIIDAFDKIIPTFYDHYDRQKGGIESVDRNDKAAFFPIITLSIGITDTTAKKFDHYGALTELASEITHYAKKTQGSCFRLDMRRPSVIE